MLIVTDTESGVTSEFPSPPGPSVPIENSSEIPVTHGVYFAYSRRGSDWECVYVGESKNMRQRLSNRPELRNVRLGFLKCGFSERKRLESLFIATLNPRLNAQSSKCQGKRALDESVCELVMRATEENAAESKSGRAHYMTTARICHVRPTMVKLAWSELDKAMRLRVRGDFATIGRPLSCPGRWIVGENYNALRAAFTGDLSACPFD